MRTAGKLLIGTITGFCAGVLVLGQASSPQSGRSDLQRQYDAAQHAQVSGNLNEAASDYRQFLAGAQGELAAEYSAAGDYGRAANLFKNALALAPDSPALRLGYAKTALLMGDFPGSEALARAFLNGNSGGFQQIAQGHQILGRALHKMNKDHQARQELQEAVNLDPSFANRYDLAVICLDLDDEKCATQTFQGMEHAFGDTPAIHMRFGLAYGNSDFVPLAITEFKKVIAKDPHYPHAHYALAAALLASGNDATNLPLAQSELKTELTISPKDFLTYAALGKLAVATHNYSEATAYLRRATLLNPSNPDAFLYLGQMYFNMHRPADAETALRKAIALTKDPARNRYQIQQAHFLLGRVLMQEHKPGAAHAEMEKARKFANKDLSQDKSQLAGLLNGAAGTAGDDTSDSSEEYTSFSAASEIDPAILKSVQAYEKHLTPAIADGYNNLGAIAATGRNYTEALGYFEHAAQWDPALEGLDLNLGRAAFSASRFQQAIPPLSRYAKAHPADSGVRGALAMSQFMTGDYRGCLESFKGVESKLSSIPQMEFVLAESLVKVGQVSLGKAKLMKLEAAHPEISDVHRALGEVFDSEGNRQKAHDEFKTALSLNPNDAEAHYDLGKLDLAHGDSTAAISELQTAIQLSPEKPQFHEQLAAAYNLASRKADAEKETAIYQKLKTQADANSKTQTRGSRQDASR